MQRQYMHWHWCLLLLLFPVGSSFQTALPPGYVWVDSPCKIVDGATVSRLSPLGDQLFLISGDQGLVSTYSTEDVARCESFLSSGESSMRMLYIDNLEDLGNSCDDGFDDDCDTQALWVDSKTMGIIRQDYLQIYNWASPFRKITLINISFPNAYFPAIRGTGFLKHAKLPGGGVAFAVENILYVYTSERGVSNCRLKSGVRSLIALDNDRVMIGMQAQELLLYSLQETTFCKLLRNITIKKGFIVDMTWAYKDLEDPAFSHFRSMELLSDGSLIVLVSDYHDEYAGNFSMLFWTHVGVDMSEKPQQIIQLPFISDSVSGALWRCFSGFLPLPDGGVAWDVGNLAEGDPPENCTFLRYSAEDLHQGRGPGSLMHFERCRVLSHTRLKDGRVMLLGYYPLDISEMVSEEPPALYFLLVQSMWSTTSAVMRKSTPLNQWFAGDAGVSMSGTVSDVLADGSIVLASQRKLAIYYPFALPSVSPLATFLPSVAQDDPRPLRLMDIQFLPGGDQFITSAYADTVGIGKINLFDARSTKHLTPPLSSLTTDPLDFPFCFFELIAVLEDGSVATGGKNDPTELLLGKELRPRQ